MLPSSNFISATTGSNQGSGLLGDIEVPSGNCIGIDDRTKILNPEPNATGTFGNSFSVSGNGLIAAVANSGFVNTWSYSGTATGRVYFFDKVSYSKNNNTSWVPREVGGFLDLDPAQALYFAKSVTLDSTGTVLVVGVGVTAGTRGGFFTYDYIDGSWQLRNSVVDSTDTYQYLGEDVSLSDDAQTLAVTGRTHLVVYINNAGQWDFSKAVAVAELSPGLTQIETCSLSGDGVKATVGSHSDSKVVYADLTTIPEVPGDQYWDNVVLAMHMDQSVVSDPLFATQRALPISGNWQDIAWNGSVFCLVNHGWNQTLISPDGKVWTQGAMPDNADWGPIESNGTVFCTPRSNGGNQMAVSTDGLAWSYVTLPRSGYWGSMKWNGSTFCLLHGEWPAAATTLRSTNGTNWTVGGDLPVSGNYRALAWNGSVFCAIKQDSNIAATSPDGLVWTPRTMPASLVWMGVEWNGSVFCAIASGTNAYATSPDGINWTPRTLPVTSTWTAIAWTGTYFYVTNTSTTTSLTSPDGINWVQKTASTTNNIQALAWNGTTLCGASTANSIAWTMEPSYAFTDLKDHTVTPYGGAVISTAQSKFGGASAYFDGTGDYLQIPDSEDFNYGSGDWTVEFFCKRNAINTAHSFIGQNAADTNPASRQCWIYTQADNIIGVDLYDTANTQYQILSNIPFSDTLSFHHIAIIRNGTTVRLFYDGTQVGSVNVGSVTLKNSVEPIRVGAAGTTSFQYYLNGYIDDLRITKGIARYTSDFTSDFTPPIASFYNIVGYPGALASPIQTLLPSTVSADYSGVAGLVYKNNRLALTTRDTNTEGRAQVLQYDYDSQTDSFVFESQFPTASSVDMTSLFKLPAVPLSATETLTPYTFVEPLGSGGTRSFTDLKGNIFTPYGGVTISSDETRFNGYSAEFTNSGDYLVSESSQDYVIGTGPMSVRFLAKVISSSADQRLFSSGPNNQAGTWNVYLDSAGKLKFEVSGVAILSDAALTGAGWKYVILKRTAAGAVEMFIDNVKQTATGTFASELTSADLRIGKGFEEDVASNYTSLVGYLKNFELVKDDLIVGEELEPIFLGQIRDQNVYSQRSLPAWEKVAAFLPFNPVTLNQSITDLVTYRKGACDAIDSDWDKCVLYSRFQGYPSHLEEEPGEHRQVGNYLACVYASSLSTGRPIEYDYAETTTYSWPVYFGDSYLNFGVYSLAHSASAVSDTGVQATKTTSIDPRLDLLQVQCDRSFFAGDISDLDLEFLKKDGTALVAIRVRAETTELTEKVTFGANLSSLSGTATATGNARFYGLISFNLLQKRLEFKAVGHTGSNYISDFNIYCDVDQIFELRISNARAKSNKTDGTGKAFVLVRKLAVPRDYFNHTVSLLPPTITSAGSTLLPSVSEGYALSGTKSASFGNFWITKDSASQPSMSFVPGEDFTMEMKLMLVSDTPGYGDSTLISNNLSSSTAAAGQWKLDIKVLDSSNLVQVPFIFSFSGLDAGEVVSSLDIHPTSLLAMDGIKAAVEYLNDWNGTTVGATGDNIFQIDYPHVFKEYFQATLNDGRLPVGKEITVVAMVEKEVYGFETFYGGGGTLTDINILSRTTGEGWLEIYYGNDESDDLTGYGFSSGKKLIAYIRGVSGTESDGSSLSEFKFGYGVNVQFDQYGSIGSKNDYGATETTGQKSTSGMGNFGNTVFGKAGISPQCYLDPDHFKSGLGPDGFTIQINATSTGLPFTLVNPSDCLTTVSAYQSGVGMGAVNTVTSCALAHTDNTYALQSDGSGGYGGANGTAGYVPITGTRNGRINRVVAGSTEIPDPDIPGDVLTVPLHRYDYTGGGVDYLMNMDGALSMTAFGN